MSENVQRLLSELRSELQNLFGEKLKDIILFGSYARGDYDKESDIDIIALVDDTDLEKYNDKIIDIEVELTIKHGVMPSILVENKAYFSRNPRREYLFENVLKDGQAIYNA
jgi:predicted nucleotidyltransferase